MRWTPDHGYIDDPWHDEMMAKDPEYAAAYEQTYAGRMEQLHGEALRTWRIVLDEIRQKMEKSRWFARYFR